MGIIERLKAGCSEPGKDFLVIGGYAVNAHGYPRQTFDLDILISKAHRDHWKNLLLGNGYQIFSEHENFLQFISPNPNEIPVDFMMVNETTFQKMLGGSVPGVLFGTSVKHPALLHLIALKLHVLRQNLQHRYRRDLYDIIQLLHINHVDVRGTEFKDLCAQFGTQEIYETILREFR